MNKITKTAKLKRYCPYCGSEAIVEFPWLTSKKINKVCEVCGKNSILKPKLAFYLLVSLLAFIIGGLVFSKYFYNLKGLWSSSIIICLIYLIAYFSVPFCSSLQKEV